MHSRGLFQFDHLLKLSELKALWKIDTKITSLNGVSKWVRAKIGNMSEKLWSNCKTIAN